MGQVFHAHADTHAKVLEHCKTNGLGVKTFVDGAVRAALEGKAKPVEKKRLPATVEAKRNGPAPWELPPFWAQRKPVEAAPEPEDEDDEEEPPRSTDSGGLHVAAPIGEPYQPISEMKLLAGF